MIEEDSYSALYLYNALIEYIYFLIILIQDKGPNDIKNIAKYVRFYKKDVHTFIQIFNGKDLTEKVSQMLCSTTSVFEIKDNVLHLTNNYSYLKQVIYEDLLVSKVVDLILRGICRIRDICQNLNFNSIISINEDNLLTTLKYYPYFHLDSNSSVILLQFHGLVGFEKHAYHTTVKYFQSYLQNINGLACKNIQLHSGCIPSCAVRNSLVIFCILHVSPLFKCKKGRISLRNTLKRKHPLEQVIDIEKLELKISSDSLPIGLVVYKALGPVILSWTGEVNSLSSCSGWIQSIVSFNNGHHGIFLVYFYKTALKYACEVGDLREFLNVCDVVEFDAEFCSEAMRNEVFWQATRIKVTNRVLKSKKYELNPDTDEYMENGNLNNHRLKPLSKVCSVRNCLVEYTVLEKENTTNHRLELNSSRFAFENISKHHDQKESEVQDVVCFSLNNSLNPHEKVIGKTEPVCNHLQISNCDNDTTSTEIKSPNFHNVSVTNLEDAFEIDVQELPKKHIEENDLHADVVTVPNKKTISHEVSKAEEFSIIQRKGSSEKNDSSMDDEVAVPHKITISHEVRNEDKVLITHTKDFLEENKLVNSIAQNGVENENKNSIISPYLPIKFSFENDLLDEKIEDVWSNAHPKLLKKCSEENKKNSVIHFNLIQSISNFSTFLFGEVSFLSSNDGVAHSSVKNKPYEVFFKKDDICFQNGAENIIRKGSTVLLYIPYVEVDELVLIATLVYPLASEETIETQKNGFNVQDFIVNHFSQIVKKNLCDTLVCNCDISKSLLVGTQLMPNFKNYTRIQFKYSKLIKKLHEICKMSDKTYKSLCSSLNQVCAQNIGGTCRKLLAHSPFSLAKSLSWIRYSKDRTLYMLKKKFLNQCKFIAKKQRHISIPDAHKKDCDIIIPTFFKENNIPTILLKPSSFEEQYSVDDNRNIVDLKTPNDKLLTVTKQCPNACHESCSSVESFSSCLDDSAKDGSDDVFYSCESDFDSIPTVYEECQMTNKPACKTNGNSFIPGNDKTSFITFTDKYSTELVDIKQNKKGHIEGAASLYLKLRHISLFKHKQNKSKVILPFKNNFCKTCYKPPIETMAEIAIIKKSHMYFKIEIKQQIVTLAFPKCLISVEMQKKIRLNSIIKITVALHPLINLSQVLYVDFQ